MTVEGEKDDICGLGQTEAAHDLCTGIPANKHVHYVQKGVGHYGVFNGRRWREEIQPRIAEMIKKAEAGGVRRPVDRRNKVPGGGPKAGSIINAFKWAS